MADNVAIRGVAYTFKIGLASVGLPGQLQDSPTLAAGDVKVKTDSGSLANITTLPTASGKIVTVSLSSSEMTGDSVVVQFSDAAGGEWRDTLIEIHPQRQDGARLAAAQDLYAPAKAGDEMSLTAGELIVLVAAIEAELANDGTGAAIKQQIVDKILENLPSIDDLSLTAIANACRDAVLNRILTGNHDTSGTPGAFLQAIAAIAANASAAATSAASADGKGSTIITGLSQLILPGRSIMLSSADTIEFRGLAGLPEIRLLKQGESDWLDADGPIGTVGGLHKFTTATTDSNVVGTLLVGAFIDDELVQAVRCEVVTDAATVFIDRLKALTGSSAGYDAGTLFEQLAEISAPGDFQETVTAALESIEETLGNITTITQYVTALGGRTVQRVTPILKDGTIELIQGDDYDDESGPDRALTWSRGWVSPDLTDATFWFICTPTAAYLATEEPEPEIEKEGSFTTDGTTAIFKAELRASDLEDLETVPPNEAQVYNYHFQARVELATGRKVTIAEGAMQLRRRIRA